jgi:hypothetical protein
MNLSDIIGVLGVIVGVVSLGYAIYERNSRARLERFFRAQNWALLDKASNANGHTQIALTKYKSLGNEKIDLDVLEFLSKADAFGQDVFKDTIRQIHYSEPEFDNETISRWIKEDRVAEKHRNLFLRLTPADQSNSQSGS